MSSHRMTVPLIVCAAVFALSLIVGGTARAYAAEPQSVYRGGTYVGSVVVEPGQLVDGDVNVIGGDATVAGTVDGDVNVVGGNIIHHGGVVNGEQHAIGGQVIDEYSPWGPDIDNQNQAYGPDNRLWWRIAWDVVVIVCFLIFPVRARMAVDRLEHHAGLAAGAGLFGWMALIPIMFLLGVTIILAPLILVEIVLFVAGVFVGTAALALLIGRRFYELLSPHSTPSPLVALVLGLALVTAAELVPVVGWVVMLLVWIVGLGSAILTFIPAAPSAGPGVPPRRPPISGPPMPIG